MVFRNLALVVGFSVLAAAVRPATFADEHVEQQAQSEEAVIRETARKYIDARRRGDAKALAAHWSPDGSYVDGAGRSFNARQLIEQQFSEAAPTSTGEPEESKRNSTIRFLTSDVAIEEGTSSGSAAGKFTAIWVKRGQDWLLTSLQDWQVANGSTPSPLDELGWIIGNWVADDNDNEVACSVTWTENKRFILLQYTVVQADRRISATQRIGWDPAARRIRSWTFDSDGGIVESRWHREGDSWIVKGAGVLPDGTQSSSVVFWIPDGTDRFIRKTLHTVVGTSKVADTVLEFRRLTDS
jgi:uncharacterized protein (TIGR02246 family)